MASVCRRPPPDWMHERGGIGWAAGEARRGAQATWMAALVGLWFRPSGDFLTREFGRALGAWASLSYKHLFQVLLTKLLVLY